MLNLNRARSIGSVDPLVTRICQFFYIYEGRFYLRQNKLDPLTAVKIEKKNCNNILCLKSSGSIIADYKHKYFEFQDYYKMVNN